MRLREDVSIRGVDVQVNLGDARELAPGQSQVARLRARPTNAPGRLSRANFAICAGVSRREPESSLTALRKTLTLVLSREFTPECHVGGSLKI